MLIDVMILIAKLFLMACDLLMVLLVGGTVAQHKATWHGVAAIAVLTAGLVVMMLCQPVEIPVARW